MSQKLRPFHLAFPIFNINETIKWYTKNLLCTIGRQDDNWVDLNFFGHQISAHLVNTKHSKLINNYVDGHNIPTRHFGIILGQHQWEKLAKQLTKNKIQFIIKPYTRFKGKKGEQSTMFIKDPSNNFLEFKSFKNDSMIFKS